jgi:O-antigen ligase
LWCAYAAAFFIPLHPKLVSLPLILFIVLSLIDIGKNTWEDFKSRPLWFKLSISAMPIYFLLHVLGMLWTENVAEGWLDVSRKMNLLFLPLALLTVPWKRQELTSILKVFLLGVGVSVMINCARMLIIYLETGDTSLLIGRNAAGIVHLGYYAIYLVFAIAIAAVMLKGKAKLKKKWFTAVLILVILGASFLLVFSGSKMGLFALLGVLLMLLVFTFNPKKWKSAILVSTLSVITLVVLVGSNNYMRNRLSDMAIHLSSEEIDNTSYESSMVRRMTWDGTWQVWQDNPIFGTGTGDIQDVLMETYLENDYTAPYLKKMDPHSQYLQSAAALGVLGLFSLLIAFLLPLFKALERRDLIMASAAFILLVSNLSEGLLERQAGIQFLSFFLPLVMILVSMDERQEEVQRAL